MTSRAAQAAIAGSIPVLLLMQAGWANGLQGRFQFSQRIENVERSGTGTGNEGLQSLTGLGFDMTSETRNQSLGLNLGTSLSYDLDEADGLEVENSSARLSYDLQNRQSALGFTLNYRETSIDDEVFVIDEETGEEIFLTDTGDVSTLRLQSRLSLGRGGPLGFTLNHSHTEREYSGTSNANLLDSTTDIATARVLLRLSDTATASVFATQNEFEEDGPGGTARTTRTIGVDGDYRINDVTSVTASLSYSDIDTNIGRGSSGLGLTFGLTHNRPNGALRFSLARQATVNGTRDQISVGRNLNFKWGQADLSYGLTQSEGLSAQPIVSARVQYNISAISQLSVALSQSAATGNANAETIRTRLNVNYSRDLTSRSRITGGLQFVEQDALSAGGVDQSSLRANIAYRHEIDRNWDLVSGVSALRNKSDAGTRESSTVFVGLERSFSFRP